LGEGVNPTDEYAGTHRYADPKSYLVPSYFVVGIVGNGGFGCDLYEVVSLLWLE